MIGDGRRGHMRKFIVRLLLISTVMGSLPLASAQEAAAGMTWRCPTGQQPVFNKHGDQVSCK